MLTLALPKQTWVHRIPAWLKVAALIIASTLLFPVDDLYVLVTALIVSAGLTISLGSQAVKQTWRFSLAVMPMVILLLLFHLFFDDLWTGVSIACRLLALVLLANVITMTTPIGEMMSLVEKMLAPLTFLPVNPRAVSVSVGLLVRFTPVFLQRASGLMEAWKVRSNRYALWRLVLPLGLSVMDDAEHVSDALRARGGIVRRS